MAKKSSAANTGPAGIEEIVHPDRRAVRLDGYARKWIGGRDLPILRICRSKDRPLQKLTRTDEFEASEEVANFEGGGFGRVGAVRDVIADVGAEVVANGTRRGFLWVSGAHRVAPLEDGAFGFENHGDDFAGAHEVG